MAFAYVGHVGYSQQPAQLVGRERHGAGGSWRCRMGLREGGGSGGVEGDIALHLLHGLMNVSVQSRNRSETLQVRERLRAVISAPSPFRIYVPQRHVREHNYGCAFGEMSDVVFQPLQLCRSERTHASSLQVHHVHKSNQVNALLVKAVPTSALCVLAVTLEVLLAVVFQHVVFTGYEKHILGTRGFEN